MKSSLYISSERIELIAYEEGGKQLAIRHYVSLPMPEGSMINGKITEPAQVTDCLQGLRKEYGALLQNITLVVDGSFLLCKKLSVPKLKRPQYLKLIEEEFAGASDEPEELICDYHTLANPGEDQLAILAVAAERATIESYVSVFAEADIYLDKIRLGVQALVLGVERVAEFEDKTFVLNVVDGVSLLSLVFDKGVHVFMSRTRLYYEDTDSLARALSENLSGLMQFNRSQHLGEIEAGYYMGLEPETMAFMRENSPHYGVELAAYSPDITAAGLSKLSQRTHFPLLALTLPDKSIDFLYNYNNIDKIKKSQQPKSRTPIFWGAIAALVLLPTLVLLLNNLLLGRSIQGFTSYLQTPVVVERASALEQITEKITYFNQVQDDVSLHEASLRQNPQLDSDILTLITSTNSASVRLTMIDYGQTKDSVEETNDTISVSGRCPDETQSATYVEALKRDPRVKSIRYTGYSYTNSEQSEFQFTIELTLAEREETT